MKKRLLILVGLLLYFQVTNAQTTDSKPQVFTGNAAVDYETSATGSQNLRYLQMQIGNPLPFNRSATTNNTNIEIGFPYNVLYIPTTFVTDDFEISKGYYSNAIKLSWRIGANEDLISSIEIRRRVLSDDTSGFEMIANLSATTYEFFDTQVDGGVLFEYQVIANGIPLVGDNLGERALNYMDGIGYRNPTATVSGSVSFDSGSPVQDVTVFAEASGSENSTSKSIHFQKDAKGALIIDDIENIPADKITLQAWVTVTGREIPLFHLKSNLGLDYQLRFGRNINTTDLRFYSDLKSEGILQRFYLKNYYPTGELDTAGNDILKRTEDIEDTEFVHVTIIIEHGKTIRYFINGREINQEYADSTNGEITLYEEYTDFIYTSDSDEYFNYLSSHNHRVKRDFHIDELRAWNKVLTNEEIRRDFRRTLDGSEGNLAIYLRMDEGAGEFLYDLSKDGFNQNKNDAFLDGYYSFDDTKPTQEQLGVFGVTDVNGSYIISGIPFKGTGESFVITPSLGVHQFEPASQTLFLGSEESVVNQVNFKDISSFNFRGKVVYNVQDVFDPIASTTPTDLRDYGYNKYLLGDVIINKGEYYYEGGSINSSTGFYEGGTLQQYPVIPLEGASILIDGNPVFDADNQLVLSDSNGEFLVSVPIGNHKVEVVKDGHVFELDGRFPEEDTFSFFEDQIETQYFIDKTRVSLVGRVVGGKNEFEKPIGFGFDGLATYVNNEGETTETTETISSINNIGVAEITFKGDVNSNDLDKIITTNSETGEYKVDLIPYQYSIDKTNGITIPSNEDIVVLGEENESLDLREVSASITSEFTAADGTALQSEDYHFEKSFRYNSDVSLLLVSQGYETDIEIGNTTYDISSLDIPIYRQKIPYNIVFEVVQKYVNKDDVNNQIETNEHFTDGTFNITNNLASTDDNAETISYNDKKYTYTFYAGIPNITFDEGFQKSINVEYIITGQNPIEIENSNDFKEFGIIKGGKASDGKTFVTTAPEFPSIILRDPPGTNSFASIKRGTSITYEETRTTNDTDFESDGYFISIGPDVTFGTGLFFTTESTVEVVAETSGTFSKTTENIDENVSQNTITFNQTISTSDDPEFVGASGDLFIGNAKNIYYGLFDNIFITEEIPEDNNNTTISNIPINVIDNEGNNKTLYVYTYKDYFVAEQDTNTFFNYSQKYILETLIPNLEALEANPSSADPAEERSPAFYRAQIALWQKVLQDNEKSKYIALTDRDAIKNDILNTITADFNGDNNSLLNDLLDQEFYSNRSFDAGLGEFTNSVTTTIVTSSSTQIIVDTEDEFQVEAGAFFNDVGATYSYNNTTNSITDDIDTSTLENTTTIEYTLKDNDKDNLLSVDVVNLFDGSGPVFITKGGATSCPYEGEEVSVFFNVEDYNNDPDAIGTGGVILSEATNKVYDIEISAIKTSIVNVPEDDAAVFTLLLKNTSQTQSDLEFVLDFDPTSLNGAEINLETNGVNVYLPYNETIEFPIEISKPSSSSTYIYENIRLLIYSPCATFDQKRENYIDLSVEFKKSCTNVSLSIPETNWIFNANEAYSTDVNGNTIANKLPITFTDFNTDFNGFERISLQYRSANSSSWTKLQSYYGSQSLKDDAGDNEGIVISGSDYEFTFNWDVVGDNIPDGEYEFRAVSFCTDNISNASEISSGVINLNAPVVFGTPQPSDGILDVGEDVSVRFNEDIFEGTSTSINVTGLKNQQEVDNSVSVYLNGSSNQIELPKQILKQNSSLTLQFWYKNATTGNGSIITQEDGFNITINGNHLDFSIGGETISTTTANQPIDASQYNFYSFVYQVKSDTTPAKMLIFENGVVLEEVDLTNDLDINTDASLFIGGTNVKGNIHNIRMWSRSFTPAEATVSKDLTLTGRELNLTGYWKLDEGYGTSALDLVKRRNAIVNLDWDIFPKGTGYEFINDEYLTLDNVNSVQISEAEDITLSFWMRADTFETSTIFSNGFGDDKEPLQTNGYRNKWSINLKADGNLELQAENTIYPLTESAIPVRSWNHIALVLRRGGTLKSFINGEEITSVSSRNLGGLSGNKFLIGARLFEDAFNIETIDNIFNGLLDEVRLWNTARSVTQIKRDRYFEIDKETDGLMLYMDFNEDPNNTTAGPAYHHADLNETIGTTFSIMKNGNTQRYRSSSPPLKPELQFTNIPFNTVINGDEMIITPSLTDEEWTLFEGQEINFTVSRLTDQYFNKQLSPVTWTALVNRQELEWFTEDNGKEIDTEKNVGETYSFTMTINNIGGSTQPYSISGIPVWMQTDSASGSVPGNSSREITFTVDEDLAMGSYTADIVLQTESGYNDRLDFSLRALLPAPDWSVNPRDFDYSISVIGQIQINGVLSRDKYTKVGAFVNNKQRGEAILTYDEIYDSYFVFLTVYSNSASGDEVTFKIWDAIEGKSLIAQITGTGTDPETASESVTFITNKIFGRKSVPVKFVGDVLTEQSIALNKGWTWTSFFVNDDSLSDISGLFSEISDFEEARILNFSEFAFLEDEVWNGSLTTLSSEDMYKIKLSEPYELKLSGVQVDETNINFTIYDGWNWLPFPIHKNVSLLDALAFYEPTDGDVIKDQFNFAIYDVSSGWSGTLHYLVANEGYMLRSHNGESQVFNYPDTRDTSAKTNQKQFAAKTTEDSFRQFEYNMNIVAEITTEEIFDSVLVFDTKGELRGRAAIVDVNGKRYSFITAYSNVSESLQFVLENTTNQIYTDITTTFINNAILGTMKNPFQINLNSLSNTDFGIHSFAVFPNPFKDEVTVNFSNNTSIETIEVYTVLGISVIKQNVKGLANTIIDAKDLANGIYLIKVTTVNGESMVQKIIKR